MRAPPEYFEQTRENAKALWRKFTDPDVAGIAGWLFEQVRRPRLVLSELLQNADDATATWARVRVDDENFEFEHNGLDFAPREFAALCHFGNSNKRELHTTGFRGIGFKSTFSVGDRVRVTTPTLDVEFDVSHYILPDWRGEEFTAETTKIRIKIRDEGARAEVAQSLDEWLRHPLSLLFFKNIRRLKLQDQTIEKEDDGAGPGGTQRWKLRAATEADYLVFETEGRDVPGPCKEEIRTVRRAGADFDIPKMKVTLVMGPEAGGRIYTVLPTEATSGLPFAINAPFLQEPDRAAIKTPATSKTNEWLLQLAGEAAGGCLIKWVQNAKLSASERAEAYVPLLPRHLNNLEGPQFQFYSLVTRAFRAIAEKHPVVLTTRGGIAHAGHARTVPGEIRGVWDDETWERNLSTGTPVRLAASEIDEVALSILVTWNWVQPLSAQAVTRRLTHAPPFPRPSKEGLTRLWRFVQEQLDYQGRITVGSEWHQQRLDPSEQLYITPRVGDPYLVRSKDIVRMPHDLADSSKKFIGEHLAVADLDDLDTTKEGLDKIGDALKLSNRAARSHILRKLLGATERDRETLVCLGHVAADLNVESPDDMPFLTKSNHYRTVEEGVFADLTGQLARLFGEAAIDKFCIAGEYEHPPQDVARQWSVWLSSDASRVQTRVEILTVKKERTRGFRGIEGVRDFIAERGGKRDVYLQYIQNTYDFEDHDLSPAILAIIKTIAQTTPTIWAAVLEEVLKTHTLYPDLLQCKLTEWGYSNSNQVQAGPMRATWVHRFRGLQCLYGEDGHSYVPLLLARRTSETESIAGSVLFVRRDMDTPSNALLFDYLGVQSTVRDPKPVLQSLEALAKRKSAEQNLLQVAKRFEVLNEIARREPSSLGTIRTTLSIIALIPTADPETPFERLQGVCIRADADDYGIPAIHPVIQSLPIWNALNIPVTPSMEQLTAWAKSIPPGPIDAATRKRLRRVLAKFGDHIANTTDRWLTLNGNWGPITTPRYWTIRRASDFSRGLTDTYLQAIADCSMLEREEDLPEKLQVRAKNLATVLSYHLDFTGAIEKERRPFSWASRIALYLARATEVSADARRWATKLGTTKFARYEGQVVATPHIAGQIAGGGKPVDIVWQHATVHVPHYRWGKLSEQLADEVHLQTGERAVADAFRACIDRSDEFIDDYMVTNFKLDADLVTNAAAPEEFAPEGIMLAGDVEVPELPTAAPAKKTEPRSATKPPSSEPRGSAAGGANANEDEDEEEEDETPGGPHADDDYTIVKTHKRRLPGEDDAPNAPSRTPRDGPERENPGHDSESMGAQEEDGAVERKSSDDGESQAKGGRKPSAARRLIHEFAIRSGYVYHERHDSYSCSDGRELGRDDGLADWVEADRRSGKRLHLVVAPGTLDEGLTLPGEVWGILLSRDREYGLLTQQKSGTPVLYMGHVLKELADRGALSYGATQCFIKRIST